MATLRRVSDTAGVRHRFAETLAVALGAVGTVALLVGVAFGRARR